MAQNVWDASYAALTAIDSNLDRELTLSEMEEYKSVYDAEMSDEEVVSEFLTLDANEDSIVSLTEICSFFDSAYANTNFGASISLLNLWGKTRQEHNYLEE